MNNSMFFDTYAFFEVINGNPKYEGYKSCEMFTTIFNLAELNYNLKKEMPKDQADKLVAIYWDYLVNVKFEDIKNAMDLKSKNRFLSIPDAVGYNVAKRLGIKFLTGDEDFRNFDNVEFVKK